jgi:hypothetical protein
MATNFRDKRTSITTMQAKNQAFAIFPTLLISHYPLPLNSVPQQWAEETTTDKVL